MNLQRRTTHGDRCKAHDSMCEVLKLAQYETKQEVAKRIFAVCGFNMDPTAHTQGELLVFLACRLAERIILV